jgi:hypothetical protein
MNRNYAVTLATTIKKRFCGVLSPSLNPKEILCPSRLFLELTSAKIRLDKRNPHRSSDLPLVL